MVPRRLVGSGEYFRQCLFVPRQNWPWGRPCRIYEFLGTGVAFCGRGLSVSWHWVSLVRRRSREGWVAQDCIKVSGVRQWLIAAHKLTRAPACHCRPPKATVYAAPHRGYRLCCRPSAHPWIPYESIGQNCPASSRPAFYTVPVQCPYIARTVPETVPEW